MTGRNAEDARPVPGQVLEVPVHDLAYGGLGVGRYGDLVVMTPGTYPGDRAEVRVRRLHPTWIEADLVRLIDRATERAQPRCAHFGPCGGCQWMDLEYRSQLAHKARQVRECLARIGRIGGYSFHGIEPSPDQFGYRNKMEFAVFGGGEALDAGLRRARDPAGIVPIETCHLQSAEANAILRETVLLAREQGLEAGRLRRIVVRRGGDGAEYLVVLVTSPGPFPEGGTLADRLRRRFPRIRGVVRMLGGEGPLVGSQLVLSGEETLTETIAGLELTLSGGAFVQVNPAQADRLYGRVLELAAARAEESALDLYCGAGAITMLLARYAHGALGVEWSRESVRCARASARRNGLTGCRFVAGDARRIASGLVREGRRFDIGTVNPPRTGLHKEIVGSVARLAPSRIVYVSCDPATLARDLSRFAHLGYGTTDVALYDMFPHTWHIETVVRLAPTGSS